MSRPTPAIVTYSLPVITLILGLIYVVRMAFREDWSTEVLAVFGAFRRVVVSDDQAFRRSARAGW
jgi:hypothetical protein